LGEKAGVLIMRLDHDRADRGVSPLDDQLFELVDYSLVR